MNLVRRLPAAVVGLSAMIWAFWFARLAVMSWDGFWFGVFDVGIFDQGTWLISQGLDPFVTLRGLYLFGDHSSYVLALLAPLYLIWSDINLLVVLAAVIPAVAGYLAYRIGIAEGLKEWTAAAVAIALLLHPAMAWTTWDSFHPETLAIALIPAAYLAARRGRLLLFALAGVLLLLVKEDAALVMIPLALYVGWTWEERRTVSIGLILIAAGITVLNFLVVLPGLSPTGELIYSGRYAFDIGPLLTASRLGYLAAMLLPVFVAVRAPLVLAIAGPITAANLASLFSYQQEIRWHYTAYLLGVLVIATPVGMAKLVDRWGPDVGLGLISSTRCRTVPLGILLVPVALAGLLILGPSLTFSEEWGGASAERQAQVYAAFESIPDDAVVAASHTFAPHLAHRKRIYMLPNPWVNDAWGVSEGVPPRPDPSIVEWIAVNLNSAGETEMSVVNDAIADGWIEVASGDEFLLLRRP